jgi:hypothetical protein
MKNIFSKILIIFCFFHISCEKDESLDPRPNLVNGQYVRLDITRDRLNLNDPNTSFGGFLTNPSKDVVRFELFIRLSRADIVQNDYIPFDVITSFDRDYAITPTMISQAFTNAGLDIGLLKKGDFFRIVGYSYNSDGVKSSYQDLSRVFIQTF